MNTLSILKQLVQIESPSGKEEKLARYVTAYLKNLGYDAFMDELNVLLSPEKEFIVATHLDTVKVLAPFSFDGEYAYGTGVADAKASITAILLALERMDSLNFGVALFYDEEEGGKGSEGFSKKYKPKKAVVMEPTNLTIASRHYGGLEIRIKVEGVAAHGANPEKGENAIEKCIEIINELKKIEEATLSVQFMHGGHEDHYAIPESCEARVEFLFKPQIKTEKVLEKVREVCYGKAELIVKEFHDGFLSRETAKILQEAMRKAGLKAKFSEMPSWSDAVNLHHLAGCDAVSFGPGELHLCHTDRERVRLKDIELAAEVLIKLNSLL